MRNKAKLILVALLIAFLILGVGYVLNRPSAPQIEAEDLHLNYAQFPDDYDFRNQKLLDQHYEKHGIDMGFSSAAEYAEAANFVIHHPDVLYKTESEDGDYCFYLEVSNEFVVLSTDGYIRTYFCPDSGKKYYDKQ